MDTKTRNEAYQWFFTELFSNCSQRTIKPSFGHKNGDQLTDEEARQFRACLRKAVSAAESLKPKELEPLAK